MPAVTIGLPVYNGAAYVAETLRSLLAQTFTDFELLVVDDASTDETAAIVESFAHADKRLRLFRNEVNRGAGHTANRLFELANGKYLARADADDVYMPDRLERQWNLMESRPDVAASGGAMRYIGDMSGTLSLPLDHDDIKSHMMFYTAMAQPVAMLRLEFFHESGLRYDENFRMAEDYDLWQRILHEGGGRLANVPEVLGKYRVHAGSISHSRKELTQNMAARVWNRVLCSLLPDVTREELALHKAICFRLLQRGQRVLDEVRDWLLRLGTMNAEKKVFAPDAWNAVLAYTFYQSVQANRNLGARVWRELMAFPGFDLLELEIS